MSSGGEPAPGDRSPDPEVRAEQDHLDRAQRGLCAMRAHAEQLLADVRAAGKPDLDYEMALAHRVAVLGESRRPLLFGRTDEAADVSWHIGRRHVEDGDGDVLVVDWRAPVSMPFYRARPADPLGLRRRRQIMVEGARVVAVADDLFDRSDSDTSTTRLRGGDALLAELERARTGEMLDIVATIQAEQDEIIRSPLEGLIIVQGGPGTGKTAVGLHRAAFLLYNHPELARTGVLVIGPSRAFLRYIAQVLPSLGEEAVVQTTIADLVPRLRVRGTDPRAIALVKGDTRMATVIERALASRRTSLEEGVTLTARHLVVTLDPEIVNALVEAIASNGGPYKAGRAALRSRLVSLSRQLLRASGRPEADEQWFAKELAASKPFTSLLDRLWPSISPTQLVSDLLTSPSLLRQAARFTLEDDELKLLQRPRPRSLSQTRWTIDDVALLDEAIFAINGQTRTYGHIVVDEAQDLSPMQFRMLTRRSVGASLTVLGDIAQATSCHEYQSWDEIEPRLPRGAGSRREELTLGYRAPGQILDFASRLLPVTAPTVRPTSSVRRGRFEPLIRSVDTAALEREALEDAHRLAGEGLLVGLIFASEAESAFSKAAGAAAEIGHLDRDAVTKPITLVPAPMAKGLEFDAVVVVEPSAIAAGSLRGLRLLYVAMTRAIQRLSIVHSQPLPGLLADPPIELAR